MQQHPRIGFKIPVLARSDGEVVDGHLRLKAAAKLRIDQIPVNGAAVRIATDIADITAGIFA